MKLAAKHRKAIRDAGPYTDRVGNVRRYDTAAMCSVALDTDQAMACVAALNAIASTPPVAGAGGGAVTQGCPERHQRQGRSRWRQPIATATP